MSNFGERLRAKREEKKLTQKEIAKKMGISRQAYARFETLELSPKAETVKRLTDAISGKFFDYVYLITDDEEDRQRMIAERIFRNKQPEIDSQKEFDEKESAIMANLGDALHGLRHTSATLLISENVDIRTVSGILGHAKPSTTIDIYAHALQDAARTAADKLDSILKTS